MVKPYKDAGLAMEASAQLGDPADAGREACTNGGNTQRLRARIRWSHWLAATLGGLVLLAGFSAMTPRNADAAVVQGYGVTMQSISSASTSASASVQILYSINVVRACQEQGHLGASFWNTTPYGWYCYNFSPSPPFWEWAGGVDMQGYCNRHYPGTRAIIYYYNLYGWRCST